MKLSITTKSALTPAGELLTWDTEWWGIRVGRTNTSDIDRWAKENTIGCICLLVPGDEPDQIQAAENRGFRFMDMRVTLARKTGPEETYVRAFRPEDVDSLAEIARVSHRITRFYADPNFPDERCDDLYETWIRSSCDGWADKVLVAEEYGEPVGYVTVHVSGDEASIGLIAVQEQMRSHGIGSALVNGAVDWAYSRQISRMTVVTQGCNAAAQRLFQRCGFLTEKTEVWLHKWIDYS